MLMILLFDIFFALKLQCTAGLKDESPMQVFRIYAYTTLTREIIQITV